MSKLLFAVTAVGCFATHLPDPATGGEVGGFGVVRGDGSIDAPFEIVHRAVDAMRSISTISSHAPVALQITRQGRPAGQMAGKRTHIRGGVYELRGNAIALDARGGVELVAYRGESPELSGGYTVAKWTPVESDRHVWAVQFPSELRRIGAVTVDGTWYDVARTSRARTIAPATISAEMSAGRRAATDGRVGACLPPHRQRRAHARPADVPSRTTCATQVRPTRV